MSRTNLDAVRIALILAALSVTTAGCSTLPKSDKATSAHTGEYSDNDEDSGRLLRLGQDSSSSGRQDSQVQQASLDRSLPTEVSDEAVVAAVVDSAANEDDGFDLEDLEQHTGQELEDP